MNSKYDVIRRVTKTLTILNSKKVKNGNEYDLKSFVTNTKYNTNASSTYDAIYDFDMTNLVARSFYKLATIL